MKPFVKSSACVFSGLLAFGLVVPARAQHERPQVDSAKSRRSFLRHEHKLAKEQQKQAKKANKRWRKEHHVEH